MRLIFNTYLELSNEGARNQDKAAQAVADIRAGAPDRTGPRRCGDQCSGWAEAAIVSICAFESSSSSVLVSQ
jgi:hypothetical protein